jgi:integrase
VEEDKRYRTSGVSRQHLSQFFDDFRPWWTFLAPLNTAQVGGGNANLGCRLAQAQVFVRPGELRHAEWTGIDLDAAEWCYTVTKTNTLHIVPFSKQAVALLSELHPLTGRGRYVFAGARSAARLMSENAVLATMRSMGIRKEEMSGHSFRAMARTILDEVLGFRPDYIEHQLAHAVRDPNGRVYNRTAHLPERRKMMQEWVDYLDELKTGGEVIPINQSA